MIKVFYSPEMSASARSFSPSSSKPEAVVEQWKELGIPIEICPVTPVTREQMYLAHHPKMVDDILDLKEVNGFGTKEEGVAAALPYTSGSMLAAAREALENGVGAVSPTSGFHHAGRDYCGGFCTFNGLMITAMVLLEEEPDLKIGILDLDQHWGDGTDDIIKANDLGQKIAHYHPGHRHKGEAEAFLHDLGVILIRHFGDCDILLYQAGADPHVNDPLGGWMTTSQLAKRDAIVFITMNLLHIPVAWNLAGGYQRDKNETIQPVLDIHNNTMTVFHRINFTGEDHAGY